MRRKPPEIDFAEEEAARLDAVKAMIGHEVPLSARYALGPRATLVSIEGDHATLEFPSGARMTRVPLRDLVNDIGYWKSTYGPQHRTP